MEFVFSRVSVVTVFCVHTACTLYNYYHRVYNSDSQTTKLWLESEINVFRPEHKTIVLGRYTNNAGLQDRPEQNMQVPAVRITRIFRDTIHIHIVSPYCGLKS